MSNVSIVKSFTNGAAALTQYQLVKTPAALVEGAAATDTCVGIVQSGAAATADVDVCIFGVTRAQAAGVITRGDLIEAGAAGQVSTHSTTSTKPVVGFALETTTAQGDEFEIFLFCQSDAGPAA